MNVSSAAASTAVSAADPTSAGTVIVAAKALSAIRQEGQTALSLIQSAVAPPTGDHRGQVVNVMA